MGSIARTLIGAFIGMAFGSVAVFLAMAAVRGLPAVAHSLTEWVVISYFAGWPLATIGAVAGAANGIVHEMRRQAQQYADRAVEAAVAAVARTSATASTASPRGGAAPDVSIKAE